jgi:lipopolysaccharide/colanic/teichoic acid biosynthesis glycosyltransferase
MATAGQHRRWPRSIGRALAPQAGELLPLCDVASLLFAGYFSLWAGAIAATAAGTPASPSVELRHLIWLAAAVAPFILYDAAFASSSARRDHAALVRGFAVRLAKFVTVIGVIAVAGGWVDGAPGGWWLAWLSTAVLLTGVTRATLASRLGRLARRGAPILPDPARSAPAIGRVGAWLPVVLLADRPIKRWSAVLKSTIDLALACLATAMLLPLMTGIALAIRLDGPGPILFRQRRHGFNNSEFHILKFRTMQCGVVAADGGLQQTVRGDPRVTRVGRFLRKWSLDELPQVFNVLGGTMSLVGPRPHAVDMRTEARLGPDITACYAHRHRVKPGITGWSQVNGARGATDTIEQLQRRVRLDLYYIEHWSPWLDLKILALTFRAVLRATNAY